MGLFDKMTGTRYPGAHVAPRSAAEVRAALLAVNRPGVPYVVRDSTAKEGADLVAVWRVEELKLTLKIRMRIVPARREVRALDEQWEAKNGERSYGRGPARTVSRQWTYERGPDGRRHKVESFRFDSRDMKNPLQAAVLNAGWTWRGVLFKL
ncbi:hypothetical protein AB0M39_25245 [Streptomyces sp. NPDC051907]|uniref:hypothetical protein n=1 Tax=Streptomyces sp. NPDC051907 TaxID=3155284 RepID=UPI003420FEC2